MPLIAKTLPSSGIYLIEHPATGRKYVGSSVQLPHRLGKHLNDLRAGRHHSQKLQRAWNKYGEPAFNFSLLEHVEDESALLVREQYWIDRLRCVERGYNVCPTAGSCRGREVTPTHREKLSAALRGRKRPPEHHAALTGVARSSETRAKISAAKKGKKLSPEVVAQRHGRPCSDETRAKMSAARKSKPRDPEVMAKAWATRRARTEVSDA